MRFRRSRVLSAFAFLSLLQTLAARAAAMQGVGVAGAAASGMLRPAARAGATAARRLATRASGAADDIRTHLSTKSPYAWRVPHIGAPSLHELPDPAGHTLAFVHVIARHGTRWPTADRTRQMLALAPLLEMVDRLRHPWAANYSDALRSAPYAAGELHPIGEDEMISLARRLRGRFPGLLGRPYFPKRYPIVSTQVARAAQSASAFALGFFEREDTVTGGRAGNGASNGERHTRPQPVAVTMLPKKRDAVLRFFEMCPAYLRHEDTVERWLAPWLWDHWESIVPDVERRLGLPRGEMQPCDVDALWQLCGYEAGLLGHLNGACSAFDASEVELLEWMEDVRLYETQGPGADINSRIAGVLLAELGAALKTAADAGAASREPLQLARLHFAHCETLTPLLTLLGLFQEEPAAEAGAAGAGAPPAAAAVSAAQAREEVGGLDSLVDDGALAVARRLAEAPVGAGAGRGPGRSGSFGSSSSSGSSSSLGSSSSGSGGAFGSGSEVSVDSLDGWAGQARSNGASSGSSGGGGSAANGGGHKHGAKAVGCSYKGRELAGGPLAPPPGWRPRAGAPGDASRAWRGGRVAPLGANLVAALYRSESDPRRHVVRLAHNEQVVSLPGCGGALECDLEEFLDRVVAPRAASAARLLELCEAGGELGGQLDASGAAAVTTADGMLLQLPLGR